MVLRIGGLWRVQARHATSGATPKSVLRAQQRAAAAVKCAEESKAVAQKEKKKARELAKEYAECARKAKWLKANAAREDAIRKRAHLRRKAKIESEYLARTKIERAEAARAIKKLQLEQLKKNLQRARVKADRGARRSVADRKRAAKLKAEAVKAARKAKEKCKLEAKRKLVCGRVLEDLANGTQTKQHTPRYRYAIRSASSASPALSRSSSSSSPNPRRTGRSRFPLPQTNGRYRTTTTVYTPPHTHFNLFKLYTLVITETA